MDYGDWDDDGGFAPAGAMLGAPYAEDAHLEMAFEDRVSGDMGYEPESLDADFGFEDSYEPYEPGPYTGDDPGDGCYDSPEDW